MYLFWMRSWGLILQSLINVRYVKTDEINRKRAVGIFTDYFLLLYCYFFDFMRVSEADTRGRPVSFSITELLQDIFRWHI